MGTAPASATNIVWSFPHLATFNFTCFEMAVSALLGGVLQKSSFPALRNITLDLPRETDSATPTPLDGICHFLSAHDLDHASLYAAETDVLELIANTRATSLLIAYPFHVETAARLLRAVKELHLVWPREHDDLGGEVVWPLVERLCTTETGLREVSLEDWAWQGWQWSPGTLHDLERENTLHDLERENMSRLVYYAFLFATKGIRFVDGDGKTLADYMLLDRMSEPVSAGEGNRTRA
jgi:hypothetical protein